VQLRTYRYGEANCSQKGELFIGAARHLPRGVKKEDYARLGYFDVWIPSLAPSRELLAAYRQGTIDFKKFASSYRREMASGPSHEMIRLVAAMASRHPVYVGCYCGDESHCHRSLLRVLIEKEAENLPPCGHPLSGGLASPPCSMPEIEF
jgi:uncharacterized protein YeaO (DUF488 family)